MVAAEASSDSALVDWIRDRLLSSAEGRGRVRRDGLCREELGCDSILMVQG
jgi:hypothetical protein